MFLESPELYDAIYHFKNYAHECEILRAVIAVAAPGARTILDVACGTGEHDKFLKDRYAVDGIDLNENYLRAARAKNPAGHYTRADMTDFDLATTYDAVTCLFSAIGYVRTVDRMNRAVACMARHVKPGGVLIVEPWITPDNWKPGKYFHSRWRNRRRQSLPHEPERPGRQPVDHADALSEEHPRAASSTTASASSSACSRATR